jgi:endonuclease/exonuclease/phosphatase family metal-dependent hydrolase
MKRLHKLLTFLMLTLFALSVGERPVRGQDNDSVELRVLTYNIHHGEGTDGIFDYDRLAKIMASTSADVIAIQEVDNGTQRAGGTNQAAELGKRLKMDHAFGNALYFSNGEYGEAILSRFPISSVQAHHLPFRHGQEPRTALAVTVSPGNGLPAFKFVGTHLCHQDEETRTDQTRELDGLFAKSPIPVILAGDLNAKPESAAMKVLESNWMDSHSPRSKIDYILIRKTDAWEIVSTRVLDKPLASDHDPVLTVLKWNKRSD